MEGILSLGYSDDTELRDPHTGINLLLVSLMLCTFTLEIRVTWEQVKLLNVSVCRGVCHTRYDIYEERPCRLVCYGGKKIYFTWTK
jgi:hypothetical protein